MRTVVIVIILALIPTLTATKTAEVIMTTVIK